MPNNDQQSSLLSSFQLAETFLLEEEEKQHWSSHRLMRSTYQAIIERSKAEYSTPNRQQQQSIAKYPTLEEILSWVVEKKMQKKNDAPVDTIETKDLWVECLRLSSYSALFIARALNYQRATFSFSSHFLVNTNQQPHGIQEALEVIIAHSIRQIEKLQTDQLLLTEEAKALQKVTHYQNFPMQLSGLNRQFQGFYLFPSELTAPSSTKREEDGEKNFNRETKNSQVLNQVNQRIHLHIVLPLIQKSLAKNLLLNFRGEDLVKRIQRNDQLDLSSVAIYDLLYLNSSSYLQQRYSILKEIMRPAFFSPYYDESLLLSLQKNAQTGQSSLQQQYAKMILYSVKAGRKNIPSILHQLSIEFLQLEQWITEGKTHPIISQTPSFFKEQQIDDKKPTEELPLVKSQPIPMNDKDQQKKSTATGSWHKDHDLDKKGKSLAEKDFGKKHTDSQEVSRLIDFLKNYGQTYHLKRTELLLTDSMINIMQRPFPEIFICLVPFIDDNENINPLSVFNKNPNDYQVYLLYNHKKIIKSAFEKALMKIETEEKYEDLFILEYLFLHLKQTHNIPQEYYKLMKRSVRIAHRDHLSFRQKFRQFFFGRAKQTNREYHRFIERKVFGLESNFH